MKRKSIAVWILCAALLTGCGQAETVESGSTEAATGQTEAESTAVSTEDADTQDSSEETTEETASPAEDTAEETETEAPKPDTGVTIEETTLFDDQGVKITAKDLTWSGNSAELGVLIENNTDQSLSFYSGTRTACNTVNGYVVSSYDSEDVAAGKKVNADLNISADELGKLGITQIGQIVVSYDVETEDNDTYLLTGPMTLETSAKDDVDLTVDTFQDAVEDGRFEEAVGVPVLASVSGDLLSGGGITVTNAVTVQWDSGYDCFLDVQNTSDNALIFSYGDVAVNGCVLSSPDWDNLSIPSGSRAILDMNIPYMADSEQFEDFGLGEITDITFDGSTSDLDSNTIKDGLSATLTFADHTAPAEPAGDPLYDEDGLRIWYAGRTADEYGADYLLTVYNDSNHAVGVTDVYDSLSLNGFMISGLVYSRVLQPGQCAGMIIEVGQYDLEDNDLTADEVESLSIGLEIEEKGKSGKSKDIQLDIDNL